MTRAFIDWIAGDYLGRIHRGLEYINFQTLVSKTSVLFIKPNLTLPTYSPGVMTSPAALEAALIALLDYTPHLFIGDSDSGGYNRFSMSEVYGRTGLNEIARKYGVKVVNLSQMERKQVTVRAGTRDIEISLPRLLTDEIDFLVTMPVPKIHMYAGVSLTYKNQWGCIPEPRDRLLLHPFFSQVVLQVNQLVKTKVAIIDGAFGLDRSGPLRGDAVELGWIVVADSPGTGARVACSLMQVPVENAAHLKLAAEMGLIPPLESVALNQDHRPFVARRFTRRLGVTDYPGLLAFRSPRIAYLAYFSPLAGILHKILYIFREPFYDYAEYAHKKAPKR